MSKLIIVTFDIDGTLTKSVGDSNRIHRHSFEHALNKVYGIPEPRMEAVQHHGSTDPLILLQLAEHYGIASETAIAKRAEAEATMVEYCNEHAGKIGSGLVVLPGAKECLEYLSKKDNVIVGLVTGNLEPIAWHKMRAVGLFDYFGAEETHWGGFGSDYCGNDYNKKVDDRANMILTAIEKAKKRCPGAEVVGQVHIGDAPTDCQAGEQAGSTVIGVTTGVFDREELEGVIHKPGSIVMDNLSDFTKVDAVLQACCA